MVIQNVQINGSKYLYVNRPFVRTVLNELR